MVFILNLFVSFIVNNQARTTGSAYFTIEEKAWLESQKLLSQAKPKAIPNLIELSRVRQFFYQLAVEKKFLLRIVSSGSTLFAHNHAPESKLQSRKLDRLSRCLFYVFH